jgi:hypothetical protein
MICPWVVYNVVQVLALRSGAFGVARCMRGCCPVIRKKKVSCGVLLDIFNVSRALKQASCLT